MNDNIIKTVGLYIIAGAATTAGAAIWNNVLQERLVEFVDKHKNDNKIIKVNFKKRLSR